MSREPRPRFGATGIGVRDLARSVDFYSKVFGMKKLLKFRLPHMNEVVLGFDGAAGGALVLMQYTDGSSHDYANTGAKLVFYVPDPSALAQRIREAGLPIEREPEPAAEFANAIIGFARDPDGYLIEILEAQPIP
jgi:lactoylglutathione lyase